MNMTTPGGKAMGIENITKIAKFGFDYVELSLMHYAELSVSERAEVQHILQENNLPCEACNNFVPYTIPLTGKRVDLARALDYGASALEAAYELGAQIVVFGSGLARKVPDGFSMKLAWDQLLAFVDGLRPFLQRYGIKLAVEHLNRKECNIITRYSEAQRFAHAVGGESVGALLDLYHVGMETEGLEILDNDKAMPIHIHAASLEGRAWPAAQDPFLEKMLMKLQKMGYTGRVSIEGFPKDLEQDCKASLVWLSYYK
ncbi:MAG: sugar phosphate isomerase/epimerase family protein [Termitinemataceae bacterium]